METQLPSPKGAQPQFSAIVYCGQTAGWTKMKMPLGVELGLGPGDCVRWGPTPRKKGTAPTQFLAHVYCGQTAGWIKMPLGREVNLGPGGGVSDGDGVAVHPKKGTAPQFSVHVYCGHWPNGWMN